jgi:hypothetical protein
MWDGFSTRPRHPAIDSLGGRFINELAERFERRVCTTTDGRRV